MHLGVLVVGLVVQKMQILIALKTFLLEDVVTQMRSLVPQGQRIPESKLAESPDLLIFLKVVGLEVSSRVLCFQKLWICLLFELVGQNRLVILRSLSGLSF